MIKRILCLTFIFVITSSIAMAEVQKIAVVDVQKVVNKSSQVQALKKEQELKQQELAKFIKQCGEEIQKQTDNTKKKALSEKYGKELKAKQEANAKAYKAKLESIDKSINNTIIQQAKTLGYDVILVKGVVLYGGDDITESILKVVK